MSPTLGRAYGFVFANILLWSVGPIFVKSFFRYYDAWTQNAFRYVSATVFLLAWAGLRRLPLFSACRGHWKSVFLVGVVNAIMQVAFVTSMAFIYPSVAILLQRFSIVVTVIISFIIFQDERGVIRSPLFFIGTLLAISGLALVILFQDAGMLEILDVSRRDFVIGVTLSLTHATFIGLYALSIRNVVRKVDPIISFTHACWITATILIVLMFLFGDMADLWQQPASGLWLMVLSAILCICFAHIAGYQAMRVVKTVVYISLLQITPVLTCLFSWHFFGEKLTLWQMLGGLAVIGGTWMTGLAQARVSRQDRKRAALLRRELQEEHLP